MKLADGVYGIELPQLDRLKGNCYLLEADRGWVVIDTGVNTSKVRQAWENALQELGAGFGDIVHILITHHHLDHIGGAGWLQQQSGAPVFILDRDYANANRYKKEEFTRLDASNFFRAHGYTQFDTVNPLVDFRAMVERLTSPQPELEQLKEGQIFWIMAGLNSRFSGRQGTLRGI